MTAHYDLGHAGLTDSALHKPTEDRRITDLVEEVQRGNPLGQPYRTAADPHSTAGLFHRGLDGENPLHFGIIVQALPHVNWYRIQLDRGHTFIAACMLSDSGFVPPGIVSTSPLPPRTEVIVFKPRATPYGIILGALPYRVAPGGRSIGTILQQGGGTGLKREQANKRPFQAFFRSGGVRDWSVHRPVDGTSMEWGKISATNIALLLDNFQAFLRVNEACGLFLNFFDSYTRLAGMNLDLQTFPWCLEAREDEGELQLISEHFLYPWEALGRYDRGEWTKEFEDQEVQYTKMKGKIDLADGDEDLQAFARYVEYGGYLGQGRLRVLVAPPKDVESGKRKFADETSDPGLFLESIGLDGSWTVASAKQTMLLKRVLIPTARRQRLPEDQKRGDDARQGNYTFSGAYKGGSSPAQEHKIGDVAIEGEQPHLRRAAGVLDLMAHALNWRAMHPFHYHQGDFRTPQISALTDFSVVQDKLDFDNLRGVAMSAPEATQLRIDPRYGQVDYFSRTSYIIQHDDGSISIGCGYGNQIRLGPDGISLETAGDVALHAGRRVLQWSDQIILRAKDSVDISATAHDIRLKAEWNTQIVSNQGGVLIESKSDGSEQVYDGKYGSEVTSAGVVLLAKQGPVAALAKEILLRTGGDHLGSGPITLDAGRGAQEINLTGNQVNCFLTSDLNIWLGDSPNTGQMTHNYQFGKTATRLDGQLYVGDSMFVRGDVLAKGRLWSKGGIVTAGRLYHQGERQYPADSTPYAPVISSQIQIQENYSDERLKIGAIQWQAQIQDRWLTSGKLGDAALHEKMGFSFRDPPAGYYESGSNQYGTAEYKLLEPRWQQMVRLGMATGGVTWEEKPIEYQGAQTYPFPGRKALVEDKNLLQYDAPTMFDAAQGWDKDRGEVYETPKLAAWLSGESTGGATLNSSYKLIF